MKKIHNTQIEMYDEERTLRALEDNLEEAVDFMRLTMDDHPGVMSEQILIVVNGVVHAFVLGGPQVEAMQVFIDYLRKLNG
jgi:hypothetical protein